jgi:protein-S-isoprenylcysteine O-methyltransferase Ste14
MSDNEDHQQGNFEQDNPGLIMPPPFFLGIALVVAFVAQNLWPITFLPPGLGWDFWSGLVLILVAMGLAIAGVGEFKLHGTNVKPSEPALNVVKSGPFKYVRNPMYSGFLLLLAGIGLTVSLEWALLLVPVLWLALQVLVIAREERYLEAKFGAEYVTYKAEVRRWGLF